MSAQLRLTLDEEYARRLDVMRGVATRTKFADYLLRWAIDAGGPAATADALDRAARDALKEQR